MISDDPVSKCPKCGADVLIVTTFEGKRTPVDAAETRIAMLRELDGGGLKIEDIVTGHASHWSTCIEQGKGR